MSSRSAITHSRRAVAAGKREHRWAAVLAGMAVIAAAVAVLAGRGDERSADAVCGELIQVNDDGAWSWFQDERAIVDDGQLLVSSTAGAPIAGGATRAGNVEVAVVNLRTRRSSVHVLSRLQPDDHTSAALLTRPDGRYLAVYSSHNRDPLTRYRVSVDPGDASRWRSEQTFDNGVGTTYSNVFHLSAERRMLDFTRTRGFDPNYLVSTDQGGSWSYGGWLVKDPAGEPGMRPYVKYASNGVDRVFFIATEGHPNTMNTSSYAGYFQADEIHRMDGSLVGPAGTTLAGAQPVTDLTRVFAAQTEGVIGNRTHAWTTDLALDGSGRPYAIFTSRVETDRAPNTSDSTDHRFHYARWNGDRWDVHELAKAGAGLYAGEEDYTGLAALHPDDPDRVYISTPFDPATGALLSSHEIYRGVTGDLGASWTWTALTTDSAVDNLRPIVPRSDSANSALLWLRGTYRSYRDYETAIVALVETADSEISCL